MKPVFQTIFGYPTGNCFNAAVASILELDAIPDIDPQLPVEEWERQWCRFFDTHGLKWESQTWEPEHNNWAIGFEGYRIAHVEIRPGVLHAIVCCDGKPVHDVGGHFHQLPRLEQEKYRCLSWSWFEPLKNGERNSFEGYALIDNFTPAPTQL